MKIRSTEVGVDDADSLPHPRECDSDIGGEQALAIAALSSTDCPDVTRRVVSWLGHGIFVKKIRKTVDGRFTFLYMVSENGFGTLVTRRS